MFYLFLNKLLKWGFLITKWTKARLKELDDEFFYWNELGDLLGWSIYAISNKNNASFLTNKERNILIEINGSQRDDIVNAIKKGK